MGKLGSIILCVLVSVLIFGSFVGLAGTSWFDERSTIEQGLILSGCACVALLVSLIPVGSALDRSTGFLRLVASTLASGKQIGPDERVPALLGQEVTRISHAAAEVASREARVSSDLRDLRVSNRIIETERDQLRGVLHALRDGIIVTDSFNEIMTLNNAAGRMFGIDPEKAPRNPVEKVLSHKRLAQLITETRDASEIGEQRDTECEILVDNETVPYQVSLEALPGKKGEVAAVVTILHDLRREREIAQMKSDFVSKASHELRTPLSSIRAYVEMLVDGEATDEESRSEFYGIIQNETERLGRMIDNMLNISRIEAGIIQIDRESVDMRDLLNRAMDTLEPQARAKDINLSIKAAPVDLTAEGDPDMLYQVILNLGSNAIKYTPEGGRVTLAADTDNLTRSIVVTVTDTGLGIPPDSLPRLFEKFYRIESFKRVAKGTGLGLNLCKHIVETVHQGQIGVESQLGMGSKFWFSIPMRYAGAQAA